MEKVVKESQSTNKTNKLTSGGKNNPGEFFASLSQTPASQISQKFNSSQKGNKAVLNSQKEDAFKQIPKIKESEGSAYNKTSKKDKLGSSKGKYNKKGAKNTSKGPVKTFGKQEIKFPEKPPLKKTVFSFQAIGSTKIESQAQSQLDQVDFKADDIPTKMTEKANVDLSGETSLDNISNEQDVQAHDLNLKKNEAAIDVYKDYGENNIIKPPSNGTLLSKLKPKSTKIEVVTIKDYKSGIDPNIIDPQFAPFIETKIGAENDKYQTAQLEHDQKVLDEENNADIKIEAEKDKSKEAQFKSAKDAQNDVAKSRTEWQTELDNTEKDFAVKSGEAAKNSVKEINSKKEEGESTAQKHIDKANSESKEAKDKADKEAAAKKAEKKKESKGFFGWLADKASALINALKDAMNFIYNKLRDAVKFIFDAAKKLIVAALEFARKAIVGLIKAFGTILKGIVDVALAAFPKLRDRIKSKIDNYVDKAVNVVNKAFELFKKAVTAILDFLASMIDKLLGLIQSIYNGILTLVGMIIRGEIGEILEKLGHVKDALLGISFESIKIGGLEELLGPLDKSLSPGEVMAAMQMGLISASDVSGNDNEGMPKAPWTTQNVGVDAVSYEELSPELQAEIRLMRQKGQTEVTLGELDDPSRTMDAVMKEATGNEKAGAEPSEENFKDGLTPMKRAEIKWELMKSGIKKWWDDNWLKVVGGIILAIVAFVVAEVVTGGAITAALPVIMPILADLFVGIMVVNLAGHFVNGLSLAWDGKTKEATKAFSRGLGAAVVELAMYLGFKVVEVAAKVVVKLLKATFKLVKAGAKAVMNFGKFIIQKGKVLFKGIAGKNLGKLSKSLRKLGDDILERMRIKKVRIRFEGRRFFIEGFINPWILMANGDLKEVSQDELRALTKENKTFKVGEGFKYVDDTGKQMEGVVVGSNTKPSTYIKQLQEIKKTQGTKGLRDEYSVLNKELQAGGDLDKIIYNRQSTYELRKGIGEIPKDFQAHHIIPRELKDKFKALFKRVGFDIEDGVKNGIGVPPNKVVLEASEKADEFANYAFHQGSHPDYTRLIEGKLIKVEQDLAKGVLTEEKAYQKIIEITNSARNAIKNGNGSKINDLLF